MDIQGFQFNRVKRDSPYDFDRSIADVALRQYTKVPRSIRECVKADRAKMIKCITDPGSLVAHPWECESKYKCSYAPICYTNTVEERNTVIATQFRGRG